MTQPVETRTKNNIERKILQRAGGMQGGLFDVNLTYPPENIVRNTEVWDKNVDFLFPGDDRVRYHRFTGDAFFKSFRNGRVRWSKPIDIENGIRLANHVQEAYDPKTGREVEKTKQVISLVRDLSISFQKQGLVPLDIQLMAVEAGEKLAGTGFVNAEKESKQEIVGKIVRAASLDSKARVNSARSRLILSHAWVDLIKELLVGKVIENKYGSIGAKFVREREFERFVLSQVNSHIDELLRVSSSFEDRRNIRELKAFAARYLSRDVIKLKPYSVVAATSRFLIMNTGSKEELDMLKKYIGEDAGMYYGTTPFTKLDKEKQISRLKGVKSMIREGLDIGELFLHTKTSERSVALEQYYSQKK